MQNTSVLLVLCDWVSLSILGSLFISIFHNLSRLEGALWTCQLYLHVYSQIQCEKLLKIDFFLSLLMKKKIWRTFTKQAGENHCLSQTLTAVKICWLFQELERSSNFHYIFALQHLFVASEIFLDVVYNLIQVLQCYLAWEERDRL